MLKTDTIPEDADLAPAPGLPGLLADMLVDQLPPGKPRATFALRMKGLSTNAIARKLRVKETSVRQYEWRAVCMARDLVQTDPVLQLLFEAAFVS